MRGFVGFPAGAVKTTPLPNLFFSAVLPQVENLVELKVTLHAFWLLHQKKGFPRYLTLRELREDGILMSALKRTGKPAEEALCEGLELTVQRQVLLHLVAEIEGIQEDLYFLNTDKGRQVVSKLRSGELDIGQIVRSSPEQVVARVDRPNIFVLYEQNIGLLTPMIADELREAEKTYPGDWAEEAFKQAVAYNRRNWKYVQRILERWALEGKSDEKGWRRSSKTFDSFKHE